jgi:hypothetical protein
VSYDGKQTRLSAILVCACLLGPGWALPGEARVTHLVVNQTRPVADGAAMDAAGPYERIDGTVFLEVDPKDPRNAIIVNLDKAPRNAKGLVEFRAPFYILKPVDPAKGNGKIWYGINNRGNQTVYSGLRAPRSTRTLGLEILSAESVSDGLLLRQGYAYVDAGWHGDGLPGGFFPQFPIARESNGDSITGPTRVEWQPPSDTYTLPLLSGFVPYQPASLDTRRATLTMRSRQSDARTVISSGEWSFGKCVDGRASLMSSPTDVCLFQGFEAQKIYELVYTAKDPIVMGLAYAVTRDVASFLRNETVDDAGHPNPLRPTAGAPRITRIYGSGGSSTGMYIREFLYLGFNADEAGRKVFDGVILGTAGAYRLFANVQFASPTVFSGQSQHQDYTSTAYPPFTYAMSTDPISGLRDGILKRPDTDPYVMQVDGGYELWDWRASLNVVDSAGKPVPQHDKVRLYFLGGAQHGSSGVGLLSPSMPSERCAHPTQALSASPTHRAIQMAMDNWVDRGIEPPPSKYPSLARRELVPLDEYRRLFPRIPGVKHVGYENVLTELNFGPDFTAAGGRVSLVPPIAGRKYQVLYPRPDRDGVDSGGIGQMEVRVPLGTNVGWNTRKGSRAGEACNLEGAYFPFATTKDERKRTGDPRPSLEERYGSHAGFVQAATAAASQLVRERLLLQVDAESYIEAAKASKILR